MALWPKRRITGSGLLNAQSGFDKDLKELWNSKDFGDNVACNGPWASHTGVHLLQSGIALGITRYEAGGGSNRGAQEYCEEQLPT